MHLGNKINKFCLSEFGAITHTIKGQRVGFVKVCIVIKQNYCLEVLFFKWYQIAACVHTETRAANENMIYVNTVSSFLYISQTWQPLARM